MIFDKWFRNHKPKLGALEIFKYIGPGFIVTVGFIDPGNWASNIAAGSQFGYSLLWVVTLSTIMLILLQHNAAHLGIVSGLCLSEASSTYLPKPVSKIFLSSAMIAAIATITAELLGSAIGLQMLFKIPIIVGVIITALGIGIVLFSNSYRRIEKYIIGFVSIIGLSFLYELFLADVSWVQSLQGSFTPSFPKNSIIIIMCILGAVVMPHNIFLHSEIIQSRQINLKDENTIKKRLRFEFMDTLIAMGLGWIINSAMIIVAAAVFFKQGIVVTELEQAKETLDPLLGNSASIVFAIALIFAGFSSSVTAAMASASIFAGMYKEPLDLKDNHSKLGAIIAIVGGIIAILFIGNTYDGLIWSQVLLSIQLPFTIFALIFLTSSKKVMGIHKNTWLNKISLLIVGIIVTVLNIVLLMNL
jgi:manganese transport protein